MMERGPQHSLRLDALSEDDAPTLHAWRSDAVLRDGALGYPFPTSVQAEIEWLRAFHPRGTPQDLCMGLREIGTSKLIGYCQLRQIDWPARVAELGIVIGAPEARGHGVGTSALALAMTYATQQLGLRRLWLRVVEFNSAAIRLYEAADFRLEGRLVRHAYRNGELHDVLVFGWEAMDASDSTTPET